MNIQSVANPPDDFRNNVYENPITSSQTPFQFAIDTKESYFESMEQHLTIADTFNTGQAGKHKTGAVKNWVGWFPVKQDVFNGAKEDPMVMTVIDVDRGGNVMANRPASDLHDLFFLL